MNRKRSICNLKMKFFVAYTLVMTSERRCLDRGKRSNFKHEPRAARVRSPYDQMLLGLHFVLASSGISKNTIFRCPASFLFIGIPTKTRKEDF